MYFFLSKIILIDDFRLYLLKEFRKVSVFVLMRLEFLKIKLEDTHPQRRLLTGCLFVKNQKIKFSVLSLQHFFKLAQRPNLGDVHILRHAAGGREFKECDSKRQGSKNDVM